MRETETITIVPAQPGWVLAVFLEGGKYPDGTSYEASFSPEDIIAWEIERSSRPFHPSVGRPGEICITRHVIPITADGTDVEHMYNDWAIRRPNGAYFIPGDRDLGTEAEALKELQARREQRRAERKTGS